MVGKLEAVLSQGTASEVVRALSLTADLGLSAVLFEPVIRCCASPVAKVRSKAVLALAASALPHHQARVDGALGAALEDPDARVRANAIEAIEALGRVGFTDALQAMARHGENRERANAIKALSGMRAGQPQTLLLEMLQDRRDAHRLSGLWVVERRRLGHFVEEVARIVRTDANVRVRARASATLRHLLRRLLHQRQERNCGRAVA